MTKLAELLPVLKNQMLQVSVGDDFEEVHTADTTYKVNGVIYGKCLDAVGDFLVMDCCWYNDKKDQFQLGNIIYVNVWFIKMMTKLADAGTLSDAMLSTTHARKMREFLSDK